MRKRPAATKRVTEKIQQKPQRVFDDALKRERNCYFTSWSKSLQNFKLILIQN